MHREQLRILHVEDDPADAALVRATLANGGVDCTITVVDGLQLTCTNPAIPGR